MISGQRDGLTVWPTLSWLHFSCNHMAAVARQVLRHVVDGKLNLLPYNKVVAVQPHELSKKTHNFFLKGAEFQPVSRMIKNNDYHFHRYETEWKKSCFKGKRKKEA